MAEIINLNRARKQAQRQGAKKQAEANRVTFGRTKAERDQAKANEASRLTKLEAHRRESED